MKYKLRALSIYEYGQRKDKEGNPHQEDWIYPTVGNAVDEKDRLFILCDGMGGHASGEVASEAVCEAMSRTITTALENGDKFSEDLLLKAIDNAYNLLDEKDTSNDVQKKMGTTMTFLMFHEEGVTIAHIGDSRVYQIRPCTGTEEDIVFQTVDHSLVNDLLRIGELTPEEAKTYPHKNVITRAMQPHLEHRYKADIVTLKDVKPGDYFYMCSDGMLEQTSNNNLCFMLNNDISDEEKRDNLIRMSKYNKDNHSAHLIHVLDVQIGPNNEETLLSTLKPSVQQMIDEEDLVSPEFGEPVNSEETLEVCVPTTCPSNSTIEESMAVSTTSRIKQKTAVKGLWRILACIATIIIAIGGICFLTLPPKNTKQNPKKEIVDKNGKETQNKKEKKGLDANTKEVKKPVSLKESEEGHGVTSSCSPSSSNDAQQSTTSTDAEHEKIEDDNQTNPNQTAKNKIKKINQSLNNGETEDVVQSDENKVQNSTK